MKLRWIAGVAVLLLSLAVANAAKADDIHLCDVSTGCSSGSLIATSSTTAYATGKSGVGETLFLAFLVPETNSSGNFNSTSNLWKALGESPSQVFPTLSSAISQLQGATGFVATSFNATDVEVGPWSGKATIDLSGYSLGPNTIVMGFIEDSTGNLIAVTPWSSSLAVSSAPEPGSLSLLGIGLIGLAFVRRRKEITL
jgi:hypothetical protein